MKEASFQEYIDRAKSWSKWDCAFNENRMGKSLSEFTRDDIAFCLMRAMEWALKNASDSRDSYKTRFEESERRAELAEEKLLEARLVIRELEKRMIR